MIDRIRQDIQQRLDQLLGEADKLRRALAALSSSDGAGRDGNSTTRSRPAARTRRGTASTGRRRRTSSASSTGTSTATRTRTRSRTAPGATKSAVLSALAGGKAMTAGEVASATGLGRATVSTTLSKLSKTGEVTKAQRGYKLGSNSSR